MNATPRLTLALAQINLLVGDVQGNLARALAEATRARDELGADLVLFPELTLSGYPPEDLLFHRGLRMQIERALRDCEARAAHRPGARLSRVRRRADLQQRGRVSRRARSSR